MQLPFMSAQVKSNEQGKTTFSEMLTVGERTKHVSAGPAGHYCGSYCYSVAVVCYRAWKAQTPEPA